MAKGIARLVVGVDLSKYSKIVVQEARELAKKLQVPITFVHVFDSAEVFASEFMVSKAEISKDCEREVRDYYSLRKAEAVEIRFGKAHEEIIDAAKKAGGALIVVGHRGHSAIARFFLGSTVERLALLSPFPVWIHRGRGLVMPKKILVACDLSARSHHTLEELAPLKSAFKASAESFYVRSEPVPVLDYQTYALVKEQLSKIEDAKVRSFKKKHPQLKIGRALAGAVSGIQERSKAFDLIALSPRNHKASAHYFGSVTAKLLRSGEKPVLVIP